MEGRVFVCTWELSGIRYRVWVRDRPTLSAQGHVFDAADEALADAICGVTGDGESVREYDPPPPQKEQSGLLFRLLSVSGERRGLIENAAELFTEDHCPQCKHERGDRTAAPLRLARLEAGGNAGYAKMKPAGFDGPFIKFFSEEFVARLRPEERSRFQWRPVHVPSRIKKRFLELVSADVPTPFASLSGVAATLWKRPSLIEKRNHTLWQCDTCGRTGRPVYGYRMSTLPVFYVNVADLPDPLPTCVGVGDREFPNLYFTRERWSDLVKLPESRGLRSSDVGVVAPSLVDPMPPVQSMAERMEQYRGARPK